MSNIWFQFFENRCGPWIFDADVVFLEAFKLRGPSPRALNCPTVGGARPRVENNTSINCCIFFRWGKVGIGRAGKQHHEILLMYLCIWGATSTFIVHSFCTKAVLVLNALVAVHSRLLSRRLSHQFHWIGGSSSQIWFLPFRQVFPAMTLILDRSWPP